MQHGRLGMVLAVLVAAGCKTQPQTQNSGSGFGSLMSQDPLTGPTGRPSSVSSGSPEELPGKAAATLCLTMAESLERDGKDAEAISYYERARQLDRGLTDRAGRRLAVLYDRTDQQAKAIIEFQELLKKKPKDSTLLNDMGYSYYNRGQWAEAEALLRRAVAADKGNKRAWVNLGMALAQLGREVEAVSAFEKGVSPAEAQANLAFVLTTQGNRAAALVAYRRALTLEPTHPIAQAAVAKLEQVESSTSVPQFLPENTGLSPLPLPDPGGS